MDGVEPLNSEINKLTTWNDRVSELPEKVHMGMSAVETLPNGADAPWCEWKCLNRLRSGVGRSKVNLQKWGYLHGDDSKCQCGAEQTMNHLLVCPDLLEPCCAEDLAEFNDKAKECVKHWSKSGI